MKLKESDLKVASCPEEEAWINVKDNIKDRMISAAINKELDEAALKVAEAKLKAFKGK